MKESGIGRDYKELCIYLEQRGERYMADIFDQILYRSNKDHTIFEKSFEHYCQNDETLAYIQQIKEAASEGVLTLKDLQESEKDDNKNREIPEELKTKKGTIGIHKKFHRITVDYMKHLKTLPPDKLPYELAILTHVLEDKLFDAVGISTDTLDEATEHLNLEQDEEYKELID